MRREERVTVQDPVKEQQPDGMSHGGGTWGGGGATQRLCGVECIVYGRMPNGRMSLAPSHYSPPDGGAGVGGGSGIWGDRRGGVAVRTVCRLHRGTKALGLRALETDQVYCPEHLSLAPPPPPPAHPGLSLRNPTFLFVKDSPQGPPTANLPTANRQPPPTGNRHQPATATNRQPPPTANRQPPPTTNRQPPPTGNRHQPPTGNRHQPATANRQPATASHCSTLFLWSCALPMS